MYIMLCERAIGSTCGVHELTYGQFSNLNLINYIQISNFIFFCGVHKVTYEEIYICLCYKTISQFKFNMLYPNFLIIIFSCYIFFIFFNLTIDLPIDVAYMIRKKGLL